MSKPFTPNARGLVVVKMIKNYDSNVAGETAGFIPAVAKELVRKGLAQLPGHEPPKTVAENFDEAAMTSRTFKPEKDPLDHDGDGKRGGSAKQPPSAELVQARADYREAFQKAPFMGWDVEEIRKRIAEKNDAET